MAQGADVGTLGAPDAQSVVPGAGLVQQLQLINGDGPGRALDLPAPAGDLVELLAADLHGGIHGGHLLYLAGEPGQQVQQVLPAGEHRVGVQGLAGDVLGVGGAAQPQPGDILLLPVLGEGHRPGGLSHKHRQDAGGHGIQGPGMAHLLGFQNAPQLRADIHRCPAGGLVDDDDSVCHGSLLV